MVLLLCKLARSGDAEADYFLMPAPADLHWQPRAAGFAERCEQTTAYRVSGPGREPVAIYRVA